MDLATIKEKRKYGDLKLAATLANIPYVDAKKGFARKKSKYHKQLYFFMDLIISNRESLIHQSTSSSKVTGNKILNITIHIGALVKEMKIQTTTLKEGVNKAQSMVTEALLSAVNDSELAGGN